MKHNPLWVPKRIQKHTLREAACWVCSAVKRLDELIGKRKKMDEARPVGPGGRTDGSMH